MGLIFSENKFKPKFWHGVILMGIVAMLMYVKSCNSNRKYNNEVQKVLSYQDTVKNYNAKDGTIVDYNNNLKTTLEAFMKATQDSMRILLENIRIPKPEVITIIKERFYVDSIPSISLNLPNCKFDTTFALREEFYEVTGRVTDKALSLQSIMIPNTVSVVIGNSKEKWWKQKEYIATVTHSNPYISTEGIQSFTIEEPRSKWSVGPYVGYGFYYDPWKGNAGHGINGGIAINYRLIGWKKK